MGNNVNIPLKISGNKYTAPEFNSMRNWSNSPWKSLGTFNPASIDLTKQGGYSDYAQSGSITFTVSGYKNGIMQMLRFTSDGSQINFDNNFSNIGFLGISDGGNLPVGDWLIMMAVMNDEVYISVPNSSAGTSSASTLLNGLIAGWNFEESSGDLLDQVGAFDGTVTGCTRGQTGIVNDCYLFNGTTDYITLGSIPDISTTDFSLGFWFKKTNAGDTNIILYDHRDGAGDGFRIYINAGNEIAVTFNGTEATTSSTINDTDWHCFIVTCDRDGNMRFILDNVNDENAGPTDISGEGNISVTNNPVIGARNFTSAVSFWDGLIDEFYIWNRVIVYNERTEFYSSGNGKTYPFS